MGSGMDSGVYSRMDSGVESGLQSGVDDGVNAGVDSEADSVRTVLRAWEYLEGLILGSTLQ